MGIKIEELEGEIYARLWELADYSVKNPMGAPQMVQTTAVYLTEVVKRWQAAGMTPEKVVERAVEAAERRLRISARRQGAKELKQILDTVEESHGDGPGDEGGTGMRRTEETSSEEASPSEDREGVPDRDRGGEDPGRGAPAEPKRGPLRKGPHRDAASGDSDPVDDTQEHPGGPSGRAPTERPKDETGGDDAEDSGDKGEAMITKTCPRCLASLGPEISSPRLSEPGQAIPSLRPCPACGWNPKDIEKGGKRRRKSRKSSPQPPKAGKAFTRS